ncbi:MAG: sulfoxide reductase catalytic subunit YedY, partial [Paracoccaceae bacterium]
MAYRWKPDLTDDDVTPFGEFLNRRQLMAGVAGLGLAAIAG